MGGYFHKNVICKVVHDFILDFLLQQKPKNATISMFEWSQMQSEKKPMCRQYREIFSWLPVCSKSEMCFDIGNDRQLCNAKKNSNSVV